MKTEVKILKTIQIRSINEFRGIPTGFNKRYMKAKPAAEHWAFNKCLSWEDRVYKDTGIRPERKDRDNREKKLYRRVLPIFERILAENK